ncbi:MAG TPA: hypothetical protein VGL82_06440 [Bryobacteraceae bacterium]|jgi:hypothetical protein
MADTAIAAPLLRTAPVDLRVERAKPVAGRFAVLCIQLALLLVVFKVYKLEEPRFFLLACLMFGGFAVSFWLPLRFKETFLILLSLAGAFLLLSPLVAGLLVAVGLLVFGIVRSPLSFRGKVLLLLGILAVATFGRSTGRLPVPREFWPVLGSVFLFRMVVYMYDLGHTTGAPPLKDYLSYFFLIPNYYFLMFPVIDFQTFRKSFFKRDIHTVAQKGIWWIFRGTTHLLLYRLIYQAQGRFSPPHVSVPMAVAAKAAFIYLLYLRISGQFHIITGMLALFGYDLPETNRYYLLARSVNDLWRRNNIYWKDFMVKIVYFPAYFRMRRQGERRAQLLATALVFAVTWFLHAVQFFWLQGKFLITLNDTVFWMILGSMVVADVWIAAVRRKRLPRTGWLPTLQRAVQIAATFAFMSLLWSMWSANSMSEWFLFLKTGNV